MMKKIYNQPTCIVAELRGRDALLTSVSGSTTLSGTGFGGNTSDNGIENADVKGVSDKSVWENEW